MLVGEALPADKLPYVEVVIRCGDTRPIALSWYAPTGNLRVSRGNAGDMAHAAEIFADLSQICQALYSIRKMAGEVAQSDIEDFSFSGEPPF
jgi:hypothetical protein